MNNQFSDTIFDKLTKSFFQHFFEALVNQKEERNLNVAFFLLLGLLAFGGVETVKLTFRRNFGKKGVSSGRMILSVITFIPLIVITLIKYFNYDNLSNPIGSASSYLATALFFSLLCVYIIIKGILAKTKMVDVINPAYRGDSYWLSFLMKGGWEQSLVQNLAEPLVFLAVGFFLLPINLFWGIPLIFCALSSWMHLALESMLELDEIRNALSNKGYVYAQGSNFSKAI